MFRTFHSFKTAFTVIETYTSSWSTFQIIFFSLPSFLFHPEQILAQFSKRNVRKMFTPRFDLNVFIDGVPVFSASDHDYQNEKSHLSLDFWNHITNWQYLKWESTRTPVVYKKTICCRKSRKTFAKLFKRKKEKKSRP